MLSSETVFHINQKISSLIVLQNCSLRELNYSYGDYSLFSILNEQRYNIKLNEDVDIDYTYDIYKIKKELKAQYPIKEWQIQEIEGYNDVSGRLINGEVNVDESKSLSLIIPNIKDNADIIKKIMKHYGYYLSWMTDLESVNDKQWINLVFYPLYSKSVTNEVRKKRFIYHITPKVNSKNILDNGLIPKSESIDFDYPPRIHFFFSFEDVQDYSYELKMKHLDIKEYTLFIIDVQHTKLKFYPDPNIRDAVYTEQCVSNKYIHSHIDIHIDDIPNYEIQ